MSRLKRMFWTELLVIVMLVGVYQICYAYTNSVTITPEPNGHLTGSVSLSAGNIFGNPYTYSVMIHGSLFLEEGALPMNDPWAYYNVGSGTSKTNIANCKPIYSGFGNNSAGNILTVNGSVYVKKMSMQIWWGNTYSSSTCKDEASVSL